jgi:hypothetical protein
MYKKLLFAIFICLNALNGFADDYPRNYSVDITHHTFELRLSDSINDMVGKATISMLFKADDVRQIRLDRINKSAKWEGNGMVGIWNTNTGATPCSSSLARWQKRTISTRSWSGMRTSRPLE